MKHYRRFSFFTALLLASGVAYADQSQLGTGDIVFVQAAADSPETIGFVPLVNIEVGTLIWFTDEGRANTGTAFSDFRLTGVNGAGSLGEGAYAWVASSNINAGTLVTISDTVHNLSLPSDGENILAFQGTLYRPTFIAGIGWDSADPFITSGTATSNNSYLPSTLTLGTNVMERSANGDNVAYTGTASGTKAALRTAINDSANWTFNNSTLPAPPASLTVTDATAAPDSNVVVAGYAFGVNTTTYTQAATVSPSHLTAGALTVRNLTGTLDADGGNGLNAQDLVLDGGFSNSLTADIANDQTFQLTLTIESGYEFDLSHFSYSMQRKGTNPPTVTGVWISLDGTNFTQLGSDLALSGTTWGIFDYTDSFSTAYTGTITFRIDAWGAGNSIDGVELDEIWLDGTLTVVPEPSTGMVLLGGVGMLMVLSRWRTRRGATV